MAVNLTKGQKVNLSKEHPGLSEVVVGLGWEAANRSHFSNNQNKGLFRGLFSAMLGGNGSSLLGETIDCDSSVFLLRNGKLRSDDDKIWYHHLIHPTGAVIHRGDNLVGSSGMNDDEQIVVDLKKLPSYYDRLVIVVNIYRAGEKGQHFGKVRNAYVRLVDNKNGRELYRYNLTENYNGYTAMIFSELYRNNGEWKFSAIGQGTDDISISGLARRYY